MIFRGIEVNNLLIIRSKILKQSLTREYFLKKSITKTFTEGIIYLYVRKFFQKNDHFLPSDTHAKNKCDALRNLVPFVQFKKHEKDPSRSITFSKAAG